MAFAGKCIRAKIAEQIIEQQSHYVLSVKGNQQGLEEDLEQAFRIEKGSAYVAEAESNHGRIEKRRCNIHDFFYVPMFFNL